MGKTALNKPLPRERRNFAVCEPHADASTDNCDEFAPSSGVLELQDRIGTTMATTDNLID